MQKKRKRVSGCRNGAFETENEGRVWKLVRKNEVISKVVVSGTN